VTAGWVAARVDERVRRHWRAGGSSRIIRQDVMKSTTPRAGVLCGSVLHCSLFGLRIVLLSFHTLSPLLWGDSSAES